MKKTCSILIPAFLLLTACQTQHLPSTSSSEVSSSEEKSEVPSSEESSSSKEETPVQDNISYEMGVSGNEAVLKKVKGSLRTQDSLKILLSLINNTVPAALLALVQFIICQLDIIVK